MESYTLTKGGRGGEPFDDAWIARTSTHPTSLTVQFSNVVHNLTLAYGTTLLSHGRGCHNSATLVLAPGEHVTRVDGRTGSLVDSLTFYTSAGRVFGPLGGQGGKAFSFRFGRSGLAYVCGRAGYSVDALCFAHLPIREEVSIVPCESIAKTEHMPAVLGASQAPEQGKGGEKLSAKGSEAGEGSTVHDKLGTGRSASTAPESKGVVTTPRMSATESARRALHVTEKMKKVGTLGRSQSLRCHSVGRPAERVGSKGSTKPAPVRATRSTTMPDSISKGRHSVKNVADGKKRVEASSAPVPGTDGLRGSKSGTCRTASAGLGGLPAPAPADGIPDASYQAVGPDETGHGSPAADMEDNSTDIPESAAKTDISAVITAGEMEKDDAVDVEAAAAQSSDDVPGELPELSKSETDPVAQTDCIAEEVNPPAIEHTQTESDELQQLDSDAGSADRPVSGTMSRASSITADPDKPQGEDSESPTVCPAVEPSKRNITTFIVPCNGDEQGKEQSTGHEGLEHCCSFLPDDTPGVDAAGSRIEETCLEQLEAPGNGPQNLFCRGADAEQAVEAHGLRTHHDTVDIKVKGAESEGKKQLMESTSTIDKVDTLGVSDGKEPGHVHAVCEPDALHLLPCNEQEQSLVVCDADTPNVGDDLVPEQAEVVVHKVLTDDPAMRDHENPSCNQAGMGETLKLSSPIDLEKATHLLRQVQVVTITHGAFVDSIQLCMGRDKVPRDNVCERGSECVAQEYHSERG